MAREDTTPALMRTAATALLGGLDDAQREKAQLAFSDDAARRHLEYRPRPRPGIALADLGTASRKAVHRLLATALSPHAYAQAMTIVALEEVLDRSEGWRRGRHSNDYWITVFGNPTADDVWGWRFEGHHISVTMTILGDQVVPAPVFLGANPARIDYAGRPVVRPLAPEEDLARALLAELTPAARIEAVVATSAPSDIRTSVSPRVEGYSHRWASAAECSARPRAGSWISWSAPISTGFHRNWRPSNKPGSRAPSCSSPGRARSRPAAVTTTACRARICSSSTTTPPTTPTTRTPCYADR